ncbi:MAG: flavodoxin family protein [Thermoguttaceae bacterium]
MKVLGISGSPRKDGNTTIAIKTALEVIGEEGIETEFLSLADLPVKTCLACYGCKGVPKCIQKDPNFDLLYGKMLEADGLLLGSPVYFGSATPNMMSLLDRAGFVARMNGNPFARKVGASIAVARRAGANFTFAQLNYFFLINEMIIPGSSYWNVAFGLGKGDVQNDEEGIQIVQKLGQNMSWLLKKIRG